LGLHDEIGELWSRTLPITIYLADESVHEQVEAAVDNLLKSVGSRIERRGDPIIDSWFHRMRATISETASSPPGQEAVTLVAHAAEARLIHDQGATITTKMVQNLGPVLTAFQPTKDAVLGCGGGAPRTMNRFGSCPEPSESYRLVVATRLKRCVSGSQAVTWVFTVQRSAASYSGRPSESHRRSSWAFARSS
jgi:hypothetical protein